MGGERSDAFGPIECGGFASREDARFAPCGEQVELGCGYSQLARVVEMILHAICATIELRNAHFDHLEKLELDTGFAQSVGHSGYAGPDFGNDLVKSFPVETSAGCFSVGHGFPDCLNQRAGWSR